MVKRHSLPVLVYDGECAFCKLWIERWSLQTGSTVDYRSYQTAADDYPDISRRAFRKGVHLILPDGTAFANARAVFRLLADYGGSGVGAWLYDHLPGFAAISEAVYRWVERNRSLCYRVVRAVHGANLAPASYRLSRWLFIRFMGLVYFFAFFSLSGQIIGLVGQNGILPAGEFLRRVHALLGVRAPLALPSLFWLSSSDAALSAATVIGVLLSLAVIAGFAQQIALAALFVLYLSLVHIGQDFLAFQWDILLLEAGFLAIFFAPSQLLPRLPRDESEPPHAVLWLIRWLLFRLMFASGFVKLASGDPTWRDLTAMSYHYYTQPLPTPLAWLADKLPMPLDQGATLLTLVIELGMPWLIFLPRRIRFVGAGGLALLQLMIAATGNYTFFNLLSFTLTLTLLDDAALRGAIPARWREQFTGTWKRYSPAVWRRAAIGLTALLIGVGSGTAIWWQIFGGAAIPAPARDLSRWMSRYGIVNTYGLFAVMTTSRPEIIIEGSNDGQTWLAYEFPSKPGDIHRTPPLVAPFQPHLDWQMWFAALGGDYRGSPWFYNLMLRLARGEPSVLALLEHNPFPDQPPRYLRAVLYDYQFSDFETLEREGAWWQRRELGEFFPVLSVQSP